MLLKENVKFQLAVGSESIPVMEKKNKALKVLPMGGIKVAKIPSSRYKEVRPCGGKMMSPRSMKKPIGKNFTGFGIGLKFGDWMLFTTISEAFLMLICQIVF